MREILHRNETYGDLTADELDEIRECAVPCLRCGRTATIDPVLHARRYGHSPAILRDGTERTWSTRRYCWERS